MNQAETHKRYGQLNAFQIWTAALNLTALALGIPVVVAAILHLPTS